MHSNRNMINPVFQRGIRRKWSVIKANAAQKLLHKITFGKFGLNDYVSLNKEEVQTIYVGSPVNYNNGFKFECEPMSFINCRCSFSNPL